MCRFPIRRSEPRSTSRPQKDLGIKINLEGVDVADDPGRASPPAVSSGSGPDIISAINNWGAALCRQRRRCQRCRRGKSARRRAAITKPRRRSPMTARSGSPSRIRLSACRSPTAPPGGNEIGYGPEKISGKAGSSGARAGKKLKAKGPPPWARQWRMPSATPNAFWYPYLWSWGGKEVEGRRQDRRAGQQGDDRIGQVRGGVVERMPLPLPPPRRGRSGMGRFSGNKPRLPVGQHQRHQQWRLDLYRSQEEARRVPDPRTASR